MGETIIEGPLYAPRKKVYPQAVHGRFRRIKWTLLVAGLAVYYLLPFVRWNRGPGMPDQAVLLDLPHRRFYFFFHRTVAAGGLLLHRPADHRGDGAVPDERGRGTDLVRISLPANHLDRPVLRRRSGGSRATGATGS